MRPADELVSELRGRRYRPLKIVLEPVFEAGFLPASFGLRLGRGQHDALQVLIEEPVHAAAPGCQSHPSLLFTGNPANRAAGDPGQRNRDPE